MPIRLRLVLVSAAGMALLAMLGGIVFIHQLRGSLDAALDATLRTRADAIVQALPEGGDGANFQDSGGGGLIARKEALAQVIGADGRVVDASEAAGTQPFLDQAALRRARRGLVRLDGTLPATREPVRLLAAPVSHPDGTWVVVVAASLEPSATVLGRTRGELLAAGSAGVVFAGAGAWILAGLALRPVERMRRTAAVISVRDTAAQLEVPGTNDEMAALAVTLNELLARLQQALARQRAFVADASHELRTPLAVLRTELELAGRPGRSRAELASAIGNAAEETDRLVVLTEDLLLLARSDEAAPVVQPAPVPLATLLAAAADGAAARAVASGVTVRHSAPPDLVAEVDPVRVRQAVDNLLDNALRWTPGGGRIDLAAARDGAHAVIEVADTGPGFPAGFLPHAFERFRRADVARSPDDGSAGLGLAIVMAIAKAHAGSGPAAHAAWGSAPASPASRSPGGRSGPSPKTSSAARSSPWSTARSSTTWSPTGHHG